MDAFKFAAGPTPAREIALVPSPGDRVLPDAHVLGEWQRQCGSDAPRSHLDHGDTLPGPEFNRMRDGLRLAGFADGSWLMADG